MEPNLLSCPSARPLSIKPWVESSTEIRQDIAGFAFDQNWVSPNTERQYWQALMDLNFSLWLGNHPFLQAMNRFGSNNKKNFDMVFRKKSFPNYFYAKKKLCWSTMGKVLCFGSDEELQHPRPYRGASSASLYLTKCQKRCFKTSWSTFVEKRMSVMIFKGQSCCLWRWGAVLLWRRHIWRHIYSENSGRCKEVVPEFVSGWDMKMTLK